MKRQKVKVELIVNIDYDDEDALRAAKKCIETTLHIGVYSTAGYNINSRRVVKILNVDKSRSDSKGK